MGLKQQFPRTHEALSGLPGGAAEAEATLSHLVQLEQNFLRPGQVRISGDGPDARHVPPEYDVALAGGGLSLLFALHLARAGRKVVVFDRRRIGCGHREWNISRPELRPLWEAGLFTEAEVEGLVRMQYATGTCRWHGGGSYPVAGVLDCVVDAEALLQALRARCEAAGVTLLDHHPLLGYRTGRGGVVVSLGTPRGDNDSDGGGDNSGDGLGGPAGPRELSARLLLDCMGAQSPHARFDLCCPTVGGVMAGLQPGKGPQELDPEVGEILVTTEGVEEGRQHIWEGFPAPGDGRMTIYLFHYCEPGALPAHPLLSLYERFFQTLPRYKRGALRLQRPTYGFIPAYTRLRPMPASPRPRVLLVGDAAGRHSPLTFCGFGSMIRSFDPVSRGIAACLDRDDLSRRALSRVFVEPPALRVMGGLTLMMIPGRRPGKAPADPQAINRLLDAAFAALYAEGPRTYAAFVKDEIGFGDFLRFMRGTARRHPSIYREVFQRLRPAEVVRWLWRLGQLAARRPALARPG